MGGVGGGGGGSFPQTNYLRLPRVFPLFLDREAVSIKAGVLTLLSCCCNMSNRRWRRQTDLQKLKI